MITASSKSTQGRTVANGELELADWIWDSPSELDAADGISPSNHALDLTRAPSPEEADASLRMPTSIARERSPTGAMSSTRRARASSDHSQPSHSSLTREDHSRSLAQQSSIDRDRSHSGRRSSVSQSRGRSGRSTILGSIASGVELAAAHGSLPQSMCPSEERLLSDGEALAEEPDTEELEEENPPDNSPYPQVRSSVPATDNVSLSISTPRMWILSIIFALLGSASNLFFSLRYPSVTITPVIALILVHPLGRIWDYLLKRPDDPIDVFDNGVGISKDLRTDFPTPERFRLWMAQGCWNEKEHACVYVSSNVSFGFAFATDVIVEQHKFYNQEVSILYQLLLTISTQILGYAFAGLGRQYLVRPPSMIWPGTLMSTAMFGTMHKKENAEANGWRVSRWRFFVYVWAGAMTWYFVPGLLMPALSYFNVLTWFAPENVVVANLFGVSSGLGLFPLTFDWAQLAYIGSPLLTPWWAAANVFTGLAVVMWIIAPILYYRNALFSAFMPIVSSLLFDNTGEPYDVMKILTPDFTFDETKFKNYSPIYIPVTYMLSYAVQFASLTALVTHTVCWYGKDIWMQTWESFSHNAEKPATRNYEAIRPDSPSSGQPEFPTQNSTSELPEEVYTTLRSSDVHNRLMERYEDVPISWYLLTLVCVLAVAIFVVEFYPVHLPWYGLLLALGITAVMFLPIAIIMAITNQHSSLYLVGQLICGYTFPGRPVANMVFTTYLYISSSQGVKFSSDLKLGHYMKIPPKLMFSVQVIATLVSSITQIGVLNWMFVNIDGICTPEAINGFNCPLARVHFNGSILWGVVGPYRFFAPDALYRKLIWAFAVGAVCPVIVWLLARKLGKRWMWKINLPLLFGSLSWIPPATGLNFSGWTLICFTFNFVIARRASAWWGKYAMTLSAALDSGLAFGLLGVFFIFIYPGVTRNFQWWGTEIYKQLVEFLHHGNTQIRQTACENLVRFSKTKPSIFNTASLTPVKDLKLLIKDYGPIAKNALTILINISNDDDVLQSLVTDDAFLETLLFRITNTREPNANEMAMLLSNMAKADAMKRLLDLKRASLLGLSKSDGAYNQLLDVFVKGASGGYNTAADYDYLAYLFADLAKYHTGAKYLATVQPYDDLLPLAKLLPFTTHPSLPRRLGVAYALKNTAFALGLHPTLLAPALGLVPALLRPLMAGTDHYADDETERLPEELQLLEPDAKREQDVSILQTLLEALMVLTGTREGREALRGLGCYYVVRECHLAVDDEGVREACDRMVQVLMRDEEGEEGKDDVRNVHGFSAKGQMSDCVEGGVGGVGGHMVTSVQPDSDEDDDDKVVVIF